ncbi:MAG: alpha-glucuronidase family glycosyl hydrolase [Janthinobacterium lividum]
MPRARAEDGSAAWLRYARLKNPAQYRVLPSRIVVIGDAPQALSAATELQRGLSGMLGRSFTVMHLAEGAIEPRGYIVIRPAATSAQQIGLNRWDVRDDTYRITTQRLGGSHQVRILGSTPRAELYGVFHLLQVVAAAQPLPSDETQTPSAPLRWTDEWDNFDGTVERGFAGPSIFFNDRHVRTDLSRAGDYARLLASIGINGCNINNVNADLQTLSSDNLREIARVATRFRPWGVRLALSVNVTSPQVVGGLHTFDPLDPAVAEWWRQKVDEIYQLIPDFAGFTVKADSEGQKGPSQYGRSPADAANVLANALKPHGGAVLYRGFVYNNHLDWNDLKADRARAGVDNFSRYDATFESNVVVQIKEGPIDFQAREAVSPLFSALRKSNAAIEVQVSQEYTGQQRHLIFLPSMWKCVLDTDMRVPGADGKPRPTPIKSIVTGRAFPNADGSQRLSGFVAVTNVGMEANWMHHPMAMANLYGFGRLAWNPDTPLAEMEETWTRLTWGDDPAVVRTIDKMLAGSWEVYEGYTGPNGMGTLTNITGPHYGPGIESAERNGWGQWFRADKHGIGMDRTAAGTGYIQQYPPELAAKYESLATTPDELLLFFHHVPYDYRLRNGKTLVQSIYDTHYEAARAAGNYVSEWMALKGQIDDQRYEQVLDLLNYQAGHAIVWRDAINMWFMKMSGIADARGRVGQDPGRVEAEAMESKRFVPVDATRWETVSGAKAMECLDVSGCILTTIVQQPRGTYDIAVQYFDLWRGASTYDLQVNGLSIATWKANDVLPPVAYDPNPDGETSKRFTAHHIALQRGDKVTVHALPDMRPELTNLDPPPQANGRSATRDYREPAVVDYIVIGPDGPVTPQ